MIAPSRARCWFLREVLLLAALSGAAALSAAQLPPAPPPGSAPPSLPMLMPSASPGGEPIRIGVIGPMSGSNKLSGIHQLNAVTLAVEETNLAGGVRGRPLVILAEDDQAHAGNDQGDEDDDGFGEGGFHLIGSLSDLDYSHIVEKIHPGCIEPKMHAGCNWGVYWMIGANLESQRTQRALRILNLGFHIL